MGNIVFFVDLKAINRGKDDKRSYLKFYFEIASKKKGNLPVGSSIPKKEGDYTFLYFPLRSVS